MRRAGGVLVAVLAVSTAQPAASAQTAPSSTPPTTGVCAIRRLVCAGLGQPATPAATEAAPVVGASPVRPASGRPVTRNSAPVSRWERRLPRPSAAIICDGAVYEDRQIDIATGEVVQSKWTCVPERPPKLTPEEPRTPDSPIVVPAPAEIWDRVPLPEPAWGISPAGDGLTGLPTQLWDPNGGVPVVASVDLAGFTATTTARPVRFEWKMWDGAHVANRNSPRSVVSSVPGSEAKPAGSYTYETRGDFTVTQTITWVGTSTLVGPGVNQVVDLRDHHDELNEELPRHRGPWSSPWLTRRAGVGRPSQPTLTASQPGSRTGRGPQPRERSP